MAPNNGAAAMRKLTKSLAPAALLAGASRIADDYVAALAAGNSVANVWATTAIRKGLVAETHGRCAYCDATIAHIATGHIEHYRPRKDYPHLVVDWSNLTIACPSCNGQKSDKFSESLPFVFPFNDSPDEHFIFNGEMIWAPYSERGAHTITELDLNSLDKNSQRLERIRAVDSYIAMWNVAHPDRKDGVRDFILQDMENGDYRATVLAHLKAARFPGV
jgi:uncharacterized protein (TIGR02646 family)